MVVSILWDVTITNCSLLKDNKKLKKKKKKGRIKLWIQSCFNLQFLDQTGKDGE